MSSKIQKAARLALALAKLPFTDNTPVEPSQAEKILEQVWPDGGKSCYLSESVQREKKVDVSVIIPTYNNEQYLHACVASVLSQETRFSYEVIVVNDGSTDGSKALLESQFGSDPHVRLVHQENKGLSGARNTGIDLAAGEYLFFLDSDDRLLPGAIEALTRAAREQNAKIVCGGYVCRYPDGTIADGEVYGNALTDPMGTLPGYAWGKLYHTSLFDHLRFPEGYWFEDSLSAQILWPLSQGAFYTIREQCYEYLINPQGISAQAAAKPKALDTLWVYRRLQEDRRQFGLTLTQGDYEHFLLMVRLSYSRTRGLSLEVKKSVFTFQRQLKQQYFPEFASGAGRAGRAVERALEGGNYRLYAFWGELPL